MLTFLLSGSGNLIYNGDYYSLEKNDLIFLHCIPEHELYPNREGMTIIYIHLDNPNLINLYDYLMSVEGPVLKFENDSINFYQTVHAIHEAIASGTYDEVRFSREIYHLLLRILESVKKRNEVVQNVPEGVKKAIIFIDENYVHHITIDEVAKAANFSKFHLEKLFNKYVNTTISKYVEYLRLKRCQELLIQTSYSVEEIAMRAGLNSSQALIRIFKRNCGMTPLKFRKNNIY